MRRAGLQKRFGSGAASRLRTRRERKQSSPTSHSTFKRLAHLGPLSRSTQGRGWEFCTQHVRFVLGQAVISLHEFDTVRELAHPSSDTPEASFDRRWAKKVFARAMQRIGEAWRERAQLLTALRPTIAGESLTEDYATIGARLG